MSWAYSDGLSCLVSCRIADKKRRKRCMAFLNCNRKATTKMRHPILGWVKCCRRCKRKLS